jgi:hypothetical protein
VNVVVGGGRGAAVGQEDLDNFAADEIAVIQYKNWSRGGSVEMLACWLNNYSVVEVEVEGNLMDGERCWELVKAVVLYQSFGSGMYSEDK